MITPQHIIDAADIAKLRAEGFVIVPREATKAIVDAGYCASAGRLGDDASLSIAYREMVKTAEIELIYEHYEHRRATQALEHLPAQSLERIPSMSSPPKFGADLTMTADEVLKLTRG
jgi:hypothetical protein